MTSRTLLALILLAVLCGLIFGIWPQFDLATAKLFYSGAGFSAAHSHLLKIVRKIGDWTPLAYLVGFLLLYGLRRFGLTARGPSGRATAFLALTMALGPGLLVNVVLKDHSHRPRPLQVQEFGGSARFRPWYRFDGACVRNCSFVSGEASEAFWMVAPAMLAPPWLRTPAIAAALAFGAAMGLLRMSFGGHFLSDVLFAGLFTLIVVVGFARELGICGAVDQKPPDARLRGRRRSL